MLKRFRSKANAANEPTGMPEVEHLGDVVMASGALVVIDFGLLGIWSHHEAPLGLYADPELNAGADAASDLEIVGSDAVDVASQIELAAAKGTFVFDMPPDGVDLVQRKVDTICSQSGLDASVETIPRMPHGERVRRLLRQLPNGVEVPFAGPWAVAIDGLPTGRVLEVHGVRMPADSPDAGAVAVGVARGRAGSPRAGVGRGRPRPRGRGTVDVL